MDIKTALEKADNNGEWCSIKIDEFEVKYPKGLRFECQCCGRCCDQPAILSTKEQLSGKFPLGLFTNEGVSMCVIKLINGICPFKKDNKCTIHKERPQVCRRFPLLAVDNNNLTRLQLWTGYDGCQGFHVGEMQYEDLKEYVDAVRRIIKEEKYFKMK